MWGGGWAERLAAKAAPKGYARAHPQSLPPQAAEASEGFSSQGRALLEAAEAACAAAQRNALSRGFSRQALHANNCGRDVVFSEEKKSDEQQ